MGRYDEALSIFQKLITDYPGSAIVPVTKLMISRVEKDKEDMKTQARRISAMDKDIITDPKTGAKYKRIAVLTGKKDILKVSRQNILSSNGKLMLIGHTVIPIQEGEPFDLLEGKPGLRGTWSPDGKMVAYYSEDAIWIVPVSPEIGRPTGPPKKLLDGKYRYQSAVSWSPDSAKIALPRRDDETDGDIWILSIEDGTLTQLTDDPGYESNACWSPDSKNIALIHRGDVWVTSAEEENPVQITKSPALEYGPFWSRGGEKIAYITEIEEGDVRLMVVSASGGEPVTILNRFENWCWSPNGESLTVISDRKISIIPLASGKAREILNLEGKGFTERFWGLKWLPDGKHVAFIGQKEEDKGVHSRIYVASTKTGEVMELAADDKSWKERIFLSPDGEWISYWTHGFIKTRSQATIWEVNVEELLREEKQ